MIDNLINIMQFMMSITYGGTMPTSCMEWPLIESHRTHYSGQYYLLGHKNPVRDVAFIDPEVAQRLLAAPPNIFQFDKGDKLNKVLDGYSLYDGDNSVDVAVFTLPGGRLVVIDPIWIKK